MYTKSIIQQRIEAIRAKDDYRMALESLMDKYTIEDSVFVYRNGKLFEATEGYFNVESIYDSLERAISECDMTTMGIRVVNNKRFETGKLYKSLLECNNDNQTLDLYSLKSI